MSLLMVFLLGMPTSNGVQFKHVKFDQDVDANAMETINKSMSSTNGTTVIGIS